jgi:acetoin utilization deacetylase AcuC-like enzyme
MKIFYDPVQKNHVLTHEIISGKRFPHHEKRSRIDVILRQLRSAGKFEFFVPERIPLEYIYAVHDEAYVKFLESSQHLPKEEVIWPYVFPCDRRLQVREPVSALTAGYYCFDVGTPIMKDTWHAAIAAASGSFAAAQHVRKTGETCYALARPPGHHATRDKFGGYCYLNNAAIAAHYFSQYGKVLLIDIDFHHGNGTQSIFYDSCEVFYLSLHGHPSVEYPYFTGWENELGIDDGYGYNLNIPLKSRCGREEYLKNLQIGINKAVAIQEPEFVVVSAGFDIADNDPLGHFGLSVDDFTQIGKCIAGMGKKTLLIQEGGYLIENLGKNVEGFLTAFL